MTVRFRALDAALLRLASADEGKLPPWPDLTGETPAHVPGWRDWLQQVWEREATVEAIEIASPDLAGRVDAVCAGREARSRRVRRVVESVMRYLLRLQSRATPFGHFSGVAPARLGHSARVRPRRRASAVARPDPAWLAAVIAECAGRPEVLRHLTVVANTLGYARTDRWVLPWQQQPGRVDQAGLGEVSIRHTRAVQVVLRAGRCPVTVADLADTVTAELVDASRARVEQMLATLVAQRVLITSLHPPMEATAPLDHVIEQLAASLPEDGPWEVVRQLRAVREQLAHYGRVTSPGQRRSIRMAATRAMAAIRAQPQPRLAIDLHADEEVELPQSVAREAESAASVLVRLSPHPFGTPAWRAYHGRFLERYGSGAVVPLGELTHPDTGLGFPNGYRGSPAPPAESAVSDRDRGLLRLAQQAAVDQHREVVLDDERVDELAPEIAQTPPDAPPHTELRFQLHATIPQALERGAFTLVVDSAARQAGALSGRFLHLFEQSDHARITQELAALPGLAPDAQLAQLSCPPLAERTQHLARAPAVVPRISLGEHPSDSAETIPVEDLAVGGNDRRLFLLSLSRACVVEPVMLNAVEFRHATHPLARFLCEITTARAASCTPFTWGIAEDLPFLPRLRYRRTVLAPARWTLTAEDLPGREAPWRKWERAWSHLRHRRRLPKRVHLGEQDRHLGLDLGEPAHLALLRRHLEDTGHAQLTEAPGVDEQGWIGGRAHEIVLPLANTQPQEAPRPGSPRLRRHGGHIPGASPWLYAHPDRQSDILTGHMPALLEHWHEGPPGQWWFLRYREPEPHLRLRMRLYDADHYGAATQRLGAWAHTLQKRGLLRRLVLDTYYPEVGRFGTATTLRAAEAAFAADSAAVLAQLTLTSHSSSHSTPSPQALTAASLIDLAAAFTGDRERGQDWLVGHPRAHPRHPPTRQMRAETLTLADPDQGPAALARLPAGPALLTAWQRRHAAVAAYVSHLDEAGDPEPEGVLASLLHLHHTRMVGIGQDSERTCFHLARATALSVTARRERSTPSPL